MLEEKYIDLLLNKCLSFKKSKSLFINYNELTYDFALKLKDYANKLMFDMDDSEYETLALEFEVILKQMDLIDKIDGIEKVEPMFFPNEDFSLRLRDDEDISVIDTKDALANAKDVLANQIKVPKVVGNDEV